MPEPSHAESNPVGDALQVLLVESDSDAITGTLSGLPGIDLRRVRTVIEATALLDDCGFDAVVLDPTVDDTWSTTAVENVDGAVDRRCPFIVLCRPHEDLHLLTRQTRDGVVLDRDNALPRLVDLLTAEIGRFRTLQAL